MVAKGAGGVPAAAVEVGVLLPVLVVGAVNRVAVEGVPEDCGVLVDFDLSASDGPVEVVSVEWVDMPAAVVERRDRVGPEDGLQPARRRRS